MFPQRSFAKKFGGPRENVSLGSAVALDGPIKLTWFVGYIYEYYRYVLPIFKLSPIQL